MSLDLRAAVDVRGLDVALRVEDGETLALLGPNGSGKSSVLAIVAGLLRPDRGRVTLDDALLTDVDRGVEVPPHARRTALLGQDPLLFPHLDAVENVAFGPRSRGVNRTEARREAHDWLDRVGVGELARRRPSQLSGGQAQRVAVARALAADPRLLLLDEPMAALDVAVLPALRQTLRSVLAPRTAVLVTHDPLDALLLADRVVVLEDGRVAEEGPTEAVLTRPRSAFAARLAGLNLLTGTWDGVDECLVSPDGLLVHGLAEGTPPVAGAATVAAFRPQAVAVYRDAPHGSPRNALAVTVTEVEPHGDLVRVKAGGLAADVTLRAAADLALAPGDPVTFVVKATEVAVYAV